jgi:glycosyltransferase involved in cell wall biosynthesis
MAIVYSPEPKVTVPESRGTPAVLRSHDARSSLRIYMMEIWSFIPYYMARLCAALRDESVEVTFGSVRYHLDRDYFRKNGIVPDGSLLDTGGRLRTSWARRLIKSIEYIANLCTLAVRFTVSSPDLLHVQYLPFLEHGFSFEIWFLRWARRLRIPIVYTAHNVTKQDDPDQGRHLYRTTYTCADALICHGEEARTELCRDFGVDAGRIWVIPHGPLFEERPRLTAGEARRALGLTGEEPVVLFQGVISEYKGIPFLLDAWKQFRKLGGKARLVIAGTGDSSILSDIRQRVSRDQLESIELWLRFISVEELPLLYQAADILVYPYRAGTTSGALLTGLKYGKAVIATKLPFFKEYLEDNRTAALVDYGDCSALATSLLELTCNREERSRLAHALLDRQSGTVSWQEIARKTRECYEGVVAKTKAPES